MKFRYSHVLAALILGSSFSVAADATSLEEALTKAEITGTVGWFGVHNDRKGESRNDSFSNGYLNVGFETAPFHGVSVGVAGWGSVQTSSYHDAYDENIADRMALSKAYLKIEQEGMGKVVLGRQDVDFNWLTDYIDGVTAEVTVIDNLVLSMAWAQSNAVIDIDEISERFTKINGHDGVYMLDAKYTPVEILELNPYLYYGNDLLDAYGMKATLSLEPSDAVKTTTMAHYVTVNSDVSDVEDGSFAQFEQGVELFGVALAAGYMRTHDDGMGGLNELGDQSPFEEGNHVFDPEAKTPYMSASYEIEGVTLSALYGQTKYYDGDADKKFKEKELDVSVSYEIIKNLEASLMYVNVDNDQKDESYNAYKAHISYNF